jgi:hypothetical protein
MNETLTTGEKILVCIAITLGAGLLAYAIIGRILGFHRPMQYIGGGQISFAGELAAGIFFLCIGLGWLHSAVWAIPAVAAFVVGFTDQTHAHSRLVAKEKKLREENAPKYPGVFDNPPPDNIESIKENEIDLFDAGSCAYLGRASKNDVKTLIERFKDIPEQGPNDIYMLVESLEMLPKGSVSSEFIMLLKKAFEKRDYLEIRWVAPVDRAKN